MADFSGATVGNGFGLASASSTLAEIGLPASLLQAIYTSNGVLIGSSDGMQSESQFSVPSAVFFLGGDHASRINADPALVRHYDEPMGQFEPCESVAIAPKHIVVPSLDPQNEQAGTDDRKS